MSENTNPRIEDSILKMRDGSNKNNALQFVAYLNEEQLTPVKCPWVDGKWKIPFGKYYLGWINISTNTWSFENFNYLQFGDYIDDDKEFTAIIHKHVKICNKPCHDECYGALDVMVFGEQFNSVCSNHGKAFSNPSKKTIKHLKKLINYSKKTVPRDHIYHCHNL